MKPEIIGWVHSWEIKKARIEYVSGLKEKGCIQVWFKKRDVFDCFVVDCRPVKVKIVPVKEKKKGKKK